LITFIQQNGPEALLFPRGKYAFISEREVFVFGSTTLFSSARGRGFVADQVAKKGAQKGRRNWLTAFRAGKFVVNPHESTVLPYWDMLIILLIVQVSFRLPYEIGFPAEGRPLILFILPASAIVARAMSGPAPHSQENGDNA